MSHSRHLVFVAALIVAACGTEPTENTPADGGAIRFNIHEISARSRACDESEARCARVKVTYPETTGGGTEVARGKIDLFLEHDMVSRMRGFVSENVGSGIDNIEGLAAAFLAEHQTFVEEFPEATAEWSIEIEASMIYNTPAAVTIDITEFAYTGGAHPNSRRRLVSFDVSTGRMLGVDDLTIDVEALTSLTEQLLRADRGLEPDADLESAGFWFPEEGFTLPDNVGVVEDGLVFHWDAYEIAPYSMGPIDVTVPAEDLATVIDQKYW